LRVDKTGAALPFLYHLLDLGKVGIVAPNKRFVRVQHHVPLKVIGIHPALAPHTDIVRGLFPQNSVVYARRQNGHHMPVFEHRHGKHHGHLARCGAFDGHQRSLPALGFLKILTVGKIFAHKLAGALLIFQPVRQNSAIQRYEPGIINHCVVIDERGQGLVGPGELRAAQCVRPLAEIGFHLIPNALVLGHVAQACLQPFKHRIQTDALAFQQRGQIRANLVAQHFFGHFVAHPGHQHQPKNGRRQNGKPHPCEQSDFHSPSPLCVPAEKHSAPWVVRRNPR